MRRFLAILAVAGGIVLLVLVGVMIAVSTIDPRQFIGPIRAHIKEVTGRDVAIGGIDLQLGLKPKLVFDDVRVGNTPWGKTPDMLIARKVEAQVALLPLLGRKFELVRLNLVEPVIVLETNASGQGNWELAAPKPGGPAPAADSGPGALGIDNLAITRGVLTYRNGATGAETHVVIDELALDARDLNAPVNAEFRGKIDGIGVALTGNLGPLATLAQRRLPYPVTVQGEVAGRKAAFAVKVQRGDGQVELQEIDAKLGDSNLKGRIDARDAGKETAWTLNLTSQSLALADLAFPGGLPVAKPAHPPGAGGLTPIFSDEPVSFDALRRNHVSGELAIGRLTLDAGRTLDGVHAKFTLHDGKLDVTTFQATAFGGTVSGHLKIDTAHGPSPAIALNVASHQLDLGALLKIAGVAREVRGGKTDVTLALTTHGNSPHKWAGGADGRVRAVIGPASIVNAKLDPDLAADRLAQAVNPFRKTQAATELRCAVVNLPLANGVATVERGIAAETTEMDVSVSGKFDFRDETLDLSFRPRVRQGIAIEIPQIAELVHFRGPFAKPALAVDYVASATALARIGAAVSTGGLSILGESLVANNAPGACDVALGKAPAPTPSGTAKANPANALSPAGDLGNALGKLLKR